MTLRAGHTKGDIHSACARAAYRRTGFPSALAAVRANDQALLNAMPPARTRNDTLRQPKIVRAGHRGHVYPRRSACAGHDSHDSYGRIARVGHCASVNHNPSARAGHGGFASNNRTPARAIDRPSVTPSAPARAMRRPRPMVATPARAIRGTTQYLLARAGLTTRTR